MSRADIIIVLIIVGIVGLVVYPIYAAYQHNTSGTAEERFVRQRVIVDPATGCHYIRGNSGTTPRMGADGKQLCGGGGK